MLKEKLLNLVDRRTIVVGFVVTLLFALAFKGEKIALAAIDGMVFVAISLVGSNAAQHSLKAFAARKAASEKSKPISEKLP